MLNKEIIRIIISSILFILSFFFEENSLLFFFLIISSYIIISYKIFIKAFKNLLNKKFFDENLLMIIATTSAFWIGEYPEAVMVILLFSLGEYLSDLAVEKSKKSITDLMDLRSDYASVKTGNITKKTDIREVKIGDEILIKPGEKIPLDGTVVDGQSYIDTTSLTGESIPEIVRPGDKVLSGCVNQNALLMVKVTSNYETSVATQIIELIKNADERKTEKEKFITRFAHIYTPIVILLAVLIVIIPTLFGADFNTWLYRALVFLVTSCPCALVISVPLAFFCGIGRASREGILIKGSNELENLSKIKTLVFDKTGTLTKGNFVVSEISSVDISEEELLSFLAHLEVNSNHPIAKAIINKYNKKIDENIIKNFEEVSGYGVKGEINGQKVMAGSLNFLKKNSIEVPNIKTLGTNVFVAINGKYQGYVSIADEIRKDAYNLSSSLAKQGINKLVMLSGDNIDIVTKTSEELKIDEYYASLLPADKVNKINDFKKNDFTAFVGDGINDAPVIKLSDLGIAMGGIGSDVTTEAADIILMNDDLTRIPLAIKISKLTIKIVDFNIIFSLTVKALLLILATFGYASIWLAVFADVGVTLIAILNTLIIMKYNFK